MTTDLISRLSAATEGSAELDREVLLACGWTRAPSPDWLPKHLSNWINPAGRVVCFGYQPRPTGSLDDIVRMIEEAGMEWQSGIMSAYVGYTLGDNDGRHSAGNHPDRRLALVLAFLRAREAGR